MTGQAERVRGIGQQFQVVTLMGAVTTAAGAFCKRFMGNLELLFQTFVTCKADCCQILTNQPHFFRDMGLVADAALSFGHRLVNNSFTEIIFLFFMTVEERMKIGIKTMAAEAHNWL